MQLSISSDLERLIEQQATAQGYSSPESFLRAVLTELPAIAHEPANTAAEFERLLDELADEDIPTLPNDFSRADIYSEHP